jgi:hypothetical protein
MSFAVMPLSDYKAACDKVREKVDLTTVKFEETDFGFLRSEVFTVTQDSVYIFSYEFSDPSKFPDLYYSSPEWEGETSPGYFEPIDSNSAETASKLYAGVQYRIFIADSLGLTPKDILKASLLLAEEIVVDFVPPPKIKSGELAEKVDEVYEAGQKAEYDRFWDDYQENGSRTIYENGFGSCWTHNNFVPKYDIKPTNGYMLFRYAPFGGIDLVEHLEKLGVTLDFSNCTSAQYAFFGAYIGRIGVVDITSTGANASSMFAYEPLLHTIDLLRVAETNTDLIIFNGCARLKNLNIEGVIATSINLSYSPLTVDSMKSVISCLKNYAGTDKELKYKVSFSSACWEALEASGASPSGGTWKDYVMYTLGWQV